MRRCRKAFLCVGQNATTSPETVPHGRGKQRVWRCPHTADAPNQTTIINTEWEKKHSSLNSRTVFVLPQAIQLNLFLIKFRFIFKTNIKVSNLKIWGFLCIAVKFCSAGSWGSNSFEERRLGRRPWTTANLPESTFQTNRREISYWNRFKNKQAWSRFTI